MKPMLAHVWEPHRVTFPCYVQPKFNGVRAVCGTDAEGRRRFQSRDELPWDYEVLRHISEALDFLPKSLVLDGELYVHGWPLQRIAGACAVARSRPSDDTLALQYVVFDVVDYSLPFAERLARCPLVRIDNDPYAVATTMLAKSESEVNNFYSVMVNEGYEGIMYRLGDCPYTVPKQAVYREWNEHDARYWQVPGNSKFYSDKDNRTWHVLKRKSWLDGEFMVVAVEEGEGKRAGKVGALVFDCSSSTTLLRGRVGSGLTDSEALHYFLHPEQVIGRKIKVKYLTLTSDGIPFNPTFEQLL